MDNTTRSVLSKDPIFNSDSEKPLEHNYVKHCEKLLLKHHPAEVNLSTRINSYSTRRKEVGKMPNYENIMHVHEEAPTPPPLALNNSKTHTHKR